MKSVTPRIKRLITEGVAVTIFRKGLTDSWSIQGVILEASSECVLVHQITQFHFNGFVIIRLEDINQIRFNRYDKHFNKILLGEGAFLSMDKPPAIPLNSFELVLECLCQTREICILEGCYRGIDEIFLIGYLNGVNLEEGSIGLLFFDTAGVFESKERSATTSLLSSIELRTEYIRCHSKYLHNDPR